MLEHQHQLKTRQLQQGHRGGDPAAGAGAYGFVVLAFSSGDVMEAQHQAAQVDHIPVAHLAAAAAHLYAVDPDSAFGENVAYLPYALVVAIEHRVGAADAGIAQAHIGAEAAADQIFPVGEGVALPLAAEAAPNLRFILLTEQGAQAAGKDQQGEQDQHKLGRGEGIAGQSFHIPPPFRA